jgi:hypothetical protein
MTASRRQVTIASAGAEPAACHDQISRLSMTARIDASRWNTVASVDPLRRDLQIAASLTSGHREHAPDL